MKQSPYIWKNGKLIDWEAATTHVLTHALHYGSGVFEGIRAYETDQGPAIFHSDAHYKRLIQSGKLVYMDIPYTADELTQATKALIQANELKSCYIRPLAYYGYGEMGLNPEGNPIDVIIVAWEWGTYLGTEGLKNGIRCKMSSWTRLDSRISPPLCKSTANYLNSALAKREAVRCGYDEAILLNTKGHVAEGPGENLFMVKDKKLITTPSYESALEGITARSIRELAISQGIEVTERCLIRDDILLADELFFTGTAAEVTPIREIDGCVIGTGRPGPITQQLQELFFETVSHRSQTFSHWLDFVTPVKA